MLEITDKNFEELVFNSKSLIMVDFFAPWCNPCKVVLPIMENINKNKKQDFLVGKIDIDKNQKYASQFSIRNLPSVLFFKDGELVAKKVGVHSEEVYSSLIEENL